jgi:hypothetical protein
MPRLHFSAFYLRIPKRAATTGIRAEEVIE